MSTCERGLGGSGGKALVSWKGLDHGLGSELLLWPLHALRLLCVPSSV